jgi:hypothetical protein
MVATPRAGHASVNSQASTYHVFGLRVQSEIELPELVAVDRGEPADVTIKFGKFPPVAGERYRGFVAMPDGAMLEVRNTARYLIRNGREIVVDPDPDGSERHVRLYLLGSAFGALLHQRRLLPLHANSIEIAGRAVAFMGHSGAGKSTMAAWFHDRGFEVLADDVCVVTFDDGLPMAQPGIPRLRMWRDALEASGRSAEAYQLAFDDAEKYNVPTRAANEVRPAQLGAIYLLRKAEANPREPLIEPLSGIEALDALVANTYRGAYVRMLGGTQAHLSSCLALVKSTPIFAVNRLWGKEYLERQIREMEEHARGVVAGS